MKKLDLTIADNLQSSGSRSSRSQPRRKILVVTAVQVERDAIKRGLKNNAGFDVVSAGVGQAAAAAHTAKLLAEGDYGMVISAGIGGGFVGKAGVGSVVVASEIIAADLGAETQEGFLSVDELGFGSNRIEVDYDVSNRLYKALGTAGIFVQYGPILTVSTVSGKHETAAALAARIPGASAEAMEGFGAAMAARCSNLPVIEFRAISNLVGPRDRTAWRIDEALQALEDVGAILMEVME